MKVLIASYVALCVLVLVWFYNIGRRPQEQVAAPEPKLPEKRLSALSESDDSSAEKRFAAAIEEDFSLRDDVDFSSAKARLERAAGAPAVAVEPDALAAAAELTEEEFPEAAHAAAAFPEPGRKQMLIAVLASWARFEPEAAADFATQKFAEEKVTEALSAIFQTWGSKDPQGALRWYEKIANSGRYQPRVGLARSLSHLYFSWAKSDPQAAGVAAQEMAEAGAGFYAWVGIAGLAGIDAHRQGVLDAAVSIEDEKARLKSLSWVVGEWAWKDPQAASGWLDDNDYTDQTTEWAVSERWSRLDPRASATWTYSRSTEETREKALSRALSGWSMGDIEAAAEWLDEVGPTEGSIPIIANGYSSVDLDKAIQWANRAAEDKRDEVIIGVLAEARMRDSEVDLKPYFEKGSLPVEEMAEKVEKHYKMLQSLF